MSWWSIWTEPWICHPWKIGTELVGPALVNKNLNKWGVRNILKASWKEFGDVEIKWVKDNMYIIFCSG